MPDAMLAVANIHQRSVDEGHDGLKIPSFLNHHCCVVTKLYNNIIPPASGNNDRKILRQKRAQQDVTTCKGTLPYCWGWTSRHFLLLCKQRRDGSATWIAFWALWNIMCVNSILTPILDAIALRQLDQIPQLTQMSTILAILSSVPIRWLFEAPNPRRRRLWKRLGWTRGETQGTSLALLNRLFALTLFMYSIAFEVLAQDVFISSTRTHHTNKVCGVLDRVRFKTPVAQAVSITFFLLVHMMKLHCLSLLWGVAMEAMECEERKRHEDQQPVANERTKQRDNTKNMRLQKLSLIGLGGTVGGFLGSFLASSMAQITRMSGLLVFTSLLLKFSADLSTGLGAISHRDRQRHSCQSANELAPLNPGMKRSSSFGSMKRISLKRIKSAPELCNKNRSLEKSIGTFSSGNLSMKLVGSTSKDNFMKLMLRGAATILRSRLLRAIFTYNALYGSTNVLLSFERAQLVANRYSSTNVPDDMAFLANINMVSSLAIFALQATGTGVLIADSFGVRGTLALIPTVRFLGLLSLAWWYQFSEGQRPNLFIFLIVDECCKVVNLAVVKPVRESLWWGLSNEARYEAKSLSDTLSHSLGGASAAFLVSSVGKLLDLMRIKNDMSGVRNIYGLSPSIVLCLVFSAWWVRASVDLGQARTNVDLGLMKQH